MAGAYPGYHSMPRSSATPFWTRCLFNAGLPPSPPPPSRMPAVPFYSPGWREPQWSKLPCLLKEATRRVRLEPQTSISVVWGVNCSATHHTSCLSIPSAGTKERKIPYPTSNPLTQLFRFVSCPNYTYEVSLTKNIFLPGWFYLKTQWWILGKGPGGPSPLIFRPNWRPKGWKKVFFRPPPLISGSGWPPPPPTLSEGQGPSCSKGV